MEQRLKTLLMLGLLFFCSSGFSIPTKDHTWSRALDLKMTIVIFREGKQTTITLSKQGMDSTQGQALFIPAFPLLEPSNIYPVSSEGLRDLKKYTDLHFFEVKDKDPCDLKEYSRKSTRSKNATRMTPVVSTKSVLKELKHSEIYTVNGKGKEKALLLLKKRGYLITPGLKEMSQNKFFVVKYPHSLSATVRTRLEPIQFRFSSARFVIPVSLFKMNLDQGQGMRIFVITKTKPMIVENYKTVKLPSGMALPFFVQGMVPQFFKALLTTQNQHLNSGALFLEHSGSSSGTFQQDLEDWAGSSGQEKGENKIREQIISPLHVTRMFSRYLPEVYKKDFELREAESDKKFELRYVIHSPVLKPLKCSNPKAYQTVSLNQQTQEAHTLEVLTGWPSRWILREMGVVLPDKRGKKDPDYQDWNVLK